VIFVARGDALLGLIALSDALKPGSRAAVQRLRREGIQVVMLTGDHHAVARRIAGEADLQTVIAVVKPHEKLTEIRALKLQTANQKSPMIVAMVGDGVNDAPALAEADVGIALGAGTDVAMESAGVTLVKGDLRGIVKARRLSRATMRNIRQNLIFAFGYNALGVPLAAGLLYPFFGLLLSPMIASAAMSASSVSVVGNALRLRRASL
jgi:Cu+-exporting ATPase